MFLSLFLLVLVKAAAGGVCVASRLHRVLEVESVVHVIALNQGVVLAGRVRVVL